MVVILDHVEAPSRANERELQQGLTNPQERAMLLLRILSTAIYQDQFYVSFVPHQLYCDGRHRSL